MAKVPKPVDKKKDVEKKNGRNLFLWLILILAAIYFLRLGTLNLEGPATELTYSGFYYILTGSDTTREVTSAVLKENIVEGRLSTGERFTVNIPEHDPELIQTLRNNVPDFKIVPPRTFLLNMFYSFVPTILFIALLWFLFYRGASQGGGKLLSFGKSRAKLLPEGKLHVTFADVAGVDEAKEELKEVIEFLKDPKKFQKLGGKMPKGVLLIGPPGCGKTMLAKAVSGEAGVPFFSISGSDFVEMFVGVGASRVRDLFEQAKRTAKQSQKGAIVFIDEIDAVGRQRFAGIGGGHDEREQTLNALLVEMDGFDTQEGVILVAASVTGDTPILIDDNGRKDVVNIGEFVNRYYKEGEEGISKEVKGISTLGYQKRAGYSVYGNKFDRACWQSVKAVYRHKVDRIYEIKYKGGKIRATGNHSVFISYRGGVKPVRVNQLKKGDVLVDLPFKVNRTNYLREVRSFYEESKNYNRVWLDVIPDYEELFEQFAYVKANSDRLSQSQLGQEIGVCQTTIGKWQMGTRRPRRIGLQEYRAKIPPRIKVTPEFLRLLGYYVAEGCSETRRHRITFSFNRREENKIEDVKRLMKDIFNIDSPYISHPVENETCIAYKNKHLNTFVGNLVGHNARTKKLPSFFFNLSKEEFLHFLETYWLSDGYEGKNGKLYACSVNRHLALQISWLCRMHGIKSNLRTSTVPERFLRDRRLKLTTAYILEICKYNNPFKPAATRMGRAKVLEVGKRKYSGYVYDLCGCENEAFFGGMNPVLLHNTNRPDVLDPALLRPGRFDRIIVVDRPDIVGREAILKVHGKDVKLDKDIDLKKIAKQTPGFSGADLANLINEAALLAARRDKKTVTMDDLQEATERVMAGPEKKSRVISKEEKTLTAYHEAGHSILSLLIPKADPMHKVSILPRGMALGYTMAVPTEDRHIYTKKKLLAEITVRLGGRASEEIIFKELSSGAHDDLKRVTEAAKNMVTRLGMSERLGHLTFGKPHEQIFLGRDIGEERDYSEDTAKIIDQEVKKIVDECYQEAKKVLTERKKELELVATTLLEKEVMDDEEVKEILKLTDKKSNSNKKTQAKKESKNSTKGNASNQQS